MLRKTFIIASLAAIAAAGFSCGSDGGSGEDPNKPSFNPVSTETTKLCPTMQAVNPTDAECSSKPMWCENPSKYEPGEDVIGAARAHGFGSLQECAGETAVLVTDVLGGSAPTTTPTSALSWFHLSDIHITDEESPVGTAIADSKGIQSALRPQDMMSLQGLDSANKTMNAFSYYHPTDFALFTGDMTNSAQKNEFDWFIKAMVGGEINPDSGAKDDPVAGPGNDPQDVFVAEGLKLPWYVLLGNHDEEIEGNGAINPGNKMDSTIDYCQMGTRNGQDFSIVFEDIPTDINRELLLHSEAIMKFVNAGGLPAGHGYTAGDAAADKGYYYFDMPLKGSDIGVRFIILDTSFRPTGFVGKPTYVYGVLAKDQFDNFIKPKVEEAKNQKKLVILAGHHPIDDLTDNGDPDNYYTGDKVHELFLANPHMIAYLEGHMHYNRIHVYKGEAGKDASPGYFEIQSTSLADWPQQFRRHEILNYGNGVFALKTVVMNHYAVAGSIAAISRELSLLDVQTGFGDANADGTASGRNAILFFKTPTGW